LGESLFAVVEAAHVWSLASVGTQMVKKVVPLLRDPSAPAKLADHNFINPVSLRVLEAIVDKFRVFGHHLASEDSLSPQKVTRVVNLQGRIDLNVLLELLNCLWQLDSVKFLGSGHFIHLFSILLLVLRRSNRLLC
jgi:hypothetical protein